MTGQSQAGPVRLLLRAPPHLPFVQGYPGIAAGGDRPVSTVQGTVEVRTTGVKAKWVRVEIRKHEAVAGSLVGKSSGPHSTVHVGSPHLLWKPPDGREFDQLSNGDFRFAMPLPAESPPSVDIRGCKVTYELIAAVCYKGKGGLFKKDSSSIATVSEPLRITKYELASAWPAYNQLEQRAASALNGAVSLVVDRPIQAFGPGDRIVVTATIRSEAQSHFRLKYFEMSLVEVLTVFPTKPDPNSKKKAKPPGPPTVKRTAVCNTRVVAEGQVIPGGDRGARLDLVVPQERQLLTVRGGKEFQVEYELVVEALCDGGPGKVVLGGLQCVIGTFPRSSAQQAVKDIGFVQGLCPRPPPGGGHQHTHSLPPSISGSSRTGSHSQDTGAVIVPAATPPRNGQANNGLLSTDQAAIYRPLSMIPPPPSNQFTTPSPPPPMPQFQQQSVPGNYQQNSYQQPNPYQQQRPTQVSGTVGFTPKWSRRSSSGTTTTTTTTYTDDHQRNSMMPNTMPASYRSSISFPAANPARTPSDFGPTFEEAESPHTPHASHHIIPTSDTGPSTNGRIHGSPAFSTSGGASASWSNHHLQDRPTNSSSPTTTMTDDTTSVAPGPPTRPDSVNTTPTRVTGAGGWTNAANEKARLYQEARNRAVSTQAAHGAVLSNIGMEGGSAPPEYTPPKPSTPVNMNNIPPITESPQSVRSLRDGSPVHAPAIGVAAFATGGSDPNGPSPPSEEPIPYDQIYPPSLFPGPSAGTSKGPAPPLSRDNSPVGYLTAQQEKDAMKARYEAAQRSVAIAQGSSSSASASPSVGSSPPQSTSGHQASPSLAQTYTGGSSQHSPHWKTAIGPSHLTSPPITSQERAFSAIGDNARPSITSSSQSIGHSRSLSVLQGQGQGSHARSVSGPQGQPWMSAADEKEQMRRRYEEARSRVDNPGTGPSSPPPGGSGTAAAGLAALGAVLTGAAAAGGSTGTGGSSSTQTSPQTPRATAYPSAQEEKDAMRRRYEEATSAVNRTVGDSSGAGPSSNPPGYSSPPPAVPGYTPVPAPAASSTTPAAYMSAAQEKEEMRRRYEEATSAVNRTVGSDAGPGPSTSTAHSVVGPAYTSPTSTSAYTSPTSTTAYTSATSPPPSSTSAYMSAEDEKAMMKRRYDEATNAVNRANANDTRGAGSSAAPYNSPAPSSPPAPPAAYMSAEQEKEMMRRRYEEATSAVNRAAMGDSPGAGPSTSTSAAPASPPGPARTQTVPAAYLSAAEEKEQMRRRFEEAQGRVERAKTAGPSSPQQVPPPLTQSPPPITQSPPPSMASSSRAPAQPQAYLSAEAEKEQMRRRYEEATSAVSRAAMGETPGAGPSSSSAPPVVVRSTTAGIPPGDQPIPYDELFGPGSCAGASLSGGEAVLSPAHMSATEEDMMRRRYEEATSAVNRAAGSPPTKPATLAGPSYKTSPPRSSTYGYPASGLNHGASMSPQPNQYPGARGMGGVGQGSSPPQRAMTLKERMASALPDGPPPPLAPRPPREYVDLLERRS